MLSAVLAVAHACYVTENDYNTVSSVGASVFTETDAAAARILEQITVLFQ